MSARNLCRECWCADGHHLRGCPEAPDVEEPEASVAVDDEEGEE